jgi:hypothetical protein
MMAGSSFPGRRQGLKKMHSTLVTKGTDIKGFSSQRLVAGFPVDQLRINLGRRSIEQLATK